jgi:hypothetical protein
MFAPWLGGWLIERSLTRRNDQAEGWPALALHDFDGATHEDLSFKVR